MQATFNSFYGCCLLWWSKYIISQYLQLLSSVSCPSTTYWVPRIPRVSYTGDKTLFTTRKLDWTRECHSIFRSTIAIPTSLEPNPPWLIRSLMFTLCNKARRGPNWGLYPNDRLLDEYGALAPWLVDPPLCTLCIQTSSCEKSTVWIRLDVLTLCSLFIQPSSEK